MTLERLIAEAALSDEAAYLRAEFERLDVLLHREILRLRASYQLSLDEFRGLYVSDEQVDALVTENAAFDDDTSAMLTEKAEAMRWLNAERRPPGSSWTRLIHEFGLTDFDVDVLMLALAAEVDLKYEQLFAYLNNDVTRKWPTAGLALSLLCRTAEDRLAQRRRIAPGGPLLRLGLLQPSTPRPDRPSALAAPLILAPPVVELLLAVCPRPAGLLQFSEWRSPEGRFEDLRLTARLAAQLRRLPALLDRERPPIVALGGRRGVGRLAAAEAVCAEMGRTLIRVDLAAIRSLGEPADRIMSGLSLQQRLEDVALYLSPADAWLDDEDRPSRESQGFAEGLKTLKSPVFLAGGLDVPWNLLLGDAPYVLLEFDPPGADERLAVWEGELAKRGFALDSETAEALADRFALTGGQITSAAQAGVDTAALYGSNGASTFEIFAEAARRQTGGDLQRLMHKVRLTFHWDDLVLPEPTIRQAREIAAAVRHAPLVYGRWGFGRRAPAGQGLKVLFAGASGTGKTMAAGVIARDLGLDLYKIDLAGIVSKYIGETEKNLERIFRAAQDSQAVLFFDEADALFGKRSEVKEAHDRYANVEVSYLLQRLEEHDGTVILASNLSKNIDEAFMRRMHCVIDFPLPDEALRLRLWQGMFSPEAPLGSDVDLAFLAKQFQLAGGEIKNVALDAAFLGAADGRAIEMRHLIRAMARQQLKRGKSPQASDFKQYYAFTS